MKVSMKLIQRITFTIAMTALVATPSFAAPGALGARAVTKEEDLLEYIKRDFSFSYFGIYDGAGLDNPFDSTTVDGDELNITHRLEPKLRLTKKLYGSVRLFYSHQLTHGQEISMNDPRVRISVPKFYSRGRFNISGNLAVQLPITLPSQDTHLVTAIRTAPTMSYDFKKSRFSIGAYSLIQFKFYDNAAQFSPKGEEDALTDFNGYLGPFVTYKISPKFTASLILPEISVNHKLVSGDLIFDSIGITPSIIWSASKNIAFEPFVTFYPDSFTADATKTGAYLSVSL